MLKYINKTALRSFLLPLIAMFLVSVLSLLIVSLLTYWFKWYAPQAMLGITVTYILTGLFGGLLQGCLQYGCLNKEYSNENHQLRQRIISGGILGALYTLILFLMALAMSDDSRLEYSRWFSIIILLVCSSILGHFLTGIFCKKGYKKL